MNEPLITTPFVETAARVDLHSRHMRIQGDGTPTLGVPDPVFGTDRIGQYYVSMPDTLQRILPGSHVTPAEFTRALQLNDTVAARMIGEGIGTVGEPMLRYEQPHFDMNIYHGSMNPAAINLSKLARTGTQDKQARADYQRNIAWLMMPLLRSQSKYSLRIIEDCIASGDTLMGLMATLQQAGHLDTTHIRIDVLVATAQSLLLMKRFSEQNNVNLSLHVGYMAYGLSAGQPIPGSQARAHANYITYPTELIDGMPDHHARTIRSLVSDDQNAYVVGDMGDAAQSLPNDFDTLHEWNMYRDDSYGDRVTNGQRQRGSEPGKPTHLYLANGGHLFRAMYNYAEPHARVNEVVAVAKRVWSSDQQFGYGVLLDKLTT